MEKKQNFKSISVYDKSNNLVKYTEFKDNDELKCHYNVNGTTLSRKYLNEYHNESPPFTETVNSVIEFNDNIMLFPDPTQSEVSLRTIVSGETFASFSYNPPTVVSRVDTYDEYDLSQTSVQTLTVKSDLIDEWVNKT